MLKKIVTIIGLIGMSYIGMQAGEAVKIQSHKRISKKSISDSCLNNCLKNEAKKQVYIKKFLETETPSKIIRGPKERDSIGVVSPNVCVYEAYYSDYGFTITSNRKNIFEEKNIKKGKAIADESNNILMISIYRCFVSKKGRAVKELNREDSKFIHEYLEKKYDEERLKQEKASEERAWKSMP